MAVRLPSLSTAVDAASRGCSATSPIERASSMDLMELATDSGPGSVQIGAILLLDSSVDLPAVRAALASRIVSVQRLRQCLLRTPVGCGAPIWVDDPRFRLDQHVREVRCPPPGDEQALLAVAPDVLVERLPMTRPLWSATLVTGLADHRCALVIVVHHVLSDGIGGLAILANLTDGAPVAPDAGFPRPAPSRARLFADAAATRLCWLANLPAALGRLRGALAELAPGRSAQAPRASLNRPTGPRRRFAIVRTDLVSVRDAAHAHGATVNDVAISAVAGALRVLLRTRGETLDEVVISMPVSARHNASADRLGNRIGVMPVQVPAGGPPGARLDRIAEITRARKRAPRASSAAVVAPMARALRRLGLLSRFINSQHLVTTFMTNLRGPELPVSFLGSKVLDLVPLSGTSGNVTVAFAVFSYAGGLTVTIVADPDACPDLPVLAAALQAELDSLTAIRTEQP